MPEVRVTATVPADPDHAFRVWTEQTDLWWRRGPRYRFLRSTSSVLRFEPGVGGRLIEIDPDDEAAGWEVGRILDWEPGRRLRFEWRLPNYAAHERTEVEIWFEPTPSGTRITLEHRGLGLLPLDHPARHGLDNGAFYGQVGRWWGDLLTALRLSLPAILDNSI